MQFDIDIDRELLNVSDDFADYWMRSLKDVLEEFVTRFEKKSPVGASRDLKNGWSYRIKSLDESYLENDAENSLFRIVGRGPGKMPPVRKLRKWAREKGINPYLVARAIGEEGTDRWRENENLLGVDSQTLEILPHSDLNEIAVRLEQELEDFRV